MPTGGHAGTGTACEAARGKSSRLGLDRTVALYVRAIAGTRYHAAGDRLTLSCDKHEQAGLNRREVLEQLVGVVTEASKLKDKFGAFPPVTHLPRYV